MSIDEFIDKLAKTAPQKKWMITDSGRIRCVQLAKTYIGSYSDAVQCPITSLRNRGSIAFQSVAEKLQLSVTDAVAIARAADFGNEDTLPLRKRILQAVGLEV